MSSFKRQIHLGLFLQGAGHHASGWRHPDARSGSDNLGHLLEVTRLAEQAKFDLVFLADGLTSGKGHHPSTAARLEPLTRLGALSTVTRKIGLASTASTTYGDPFHLARAFASIDHLSNGRAAWNLVTTSYARTAANFGRNAHLDHADRYAVAEEFVDVVKGLWDSWEEDALPKNKETGVYYIPEKLHALNHNGHYFSVQGPLNIPRSPQGHPVVIQAGSSDRGQALAARTADVVFTAQQTLADAQAFYAGLKSQLAAHGRKADDIAIMPGFLPIIGRTKNEAQEKLDQLEHWTDAREVLPLLSERLGHDMSVFDLDGPLPDLPETEQLKSRQKLLIELARRENLTIRQLAQRVATSRGHHVLLGTAEEVADELQNWFENGAADGFNIMPAYFPGELINFTSQVIPILQERGLFRRDYEADTLRGHFGWSRVPSPYA
ncbi:LLM class flavin-dependent oxidoreductase [Bradyrhizobium sp. SSUT18]|uniref:LLM class flavin-dependent oxidoreductase n=1 Tax=Bradyrhizobium sp. SSUT18 TaxID=3040602 RepID=UPI002449D838|nr:LLM class flavin-dependent oxidoreductase [Bradyrhizobium sp. SSUT18]MDH2399913.1 LLM class flavin-dependent oxidoreductase [Bradyrhizobium sp. SSUT18]